MAPELIIVTTKTKSERMVSWLLDHSKFVTDPCHTESAVLTPMTVILAHEQWRVEGITALLKEKDFRAISLHGGHNSTYREMVAREFRLRRFDIVVCSNGLDLHANFPVPKHIITVDLPPTLTGNQFVCSNAILVDIERMSDLRVLRTIYDYLVVSRSEVPGWVYEHMER